MGVTDLNVNFLGNWGFLPAVFHHVFRPTGVRTTHGAFTPVVRGEEPRKYEGYYAVL